MTYLESFSLLARPQQMSLCGFLTRCPPRDGDRHCGEQRAPHDPGVSNSWRFLPSRLRVKPQFTPRVSEVWSVYDRYPSPPHVNEIRRRIRTDGSRGLLNATTAQHEGRAQDSQTRMSAGISTPVNQSWRCMSIFSKLLLWIVLLSETT